LARRSFTENVTRSGRQPAGGHPAYRRWVALLLVFGRAVCSDRRSLRSAHLYDTWADRGGNAFRQSAVPGQPEREAFALTDEELERVAMIDGASPWQAFWHVTLPQAWRGVLGGAVMMWAQVSAIRCGSHPGYNPKIGRC